MNKYELARLCKTSQSVNKVEYIQTLCRDKTVLDLGCIRHSAGFAISDPNWLHKKIKDVAKKVIGIDYLTEEVKKIRGLGYDIRYGDVTKPLPLEETFDVIVAADLIEHLTNFKGFFKNCLRFLNEEGCLIITTPNPFYTDQFHYVAFKEQFVMNPEHTCWIDPYAMIQLTARFGLELQDIRYIKPSWQLADMVCEREGFDYNILNDRWSDTSFMSNALRFGIGWVFQVFFVLYATLTLTDTELVRYADYIVVLKGNGENQV